MPAQGRRPGFGQYSHWASGQNQAKVRPLAATLTGNALNEGPLIRRIRAPNPTRPWDLGLMAKTELLIDFLRCAGIVFS